MEKGTSYVGMDDHKEKVNVAVLLPGETKPVEWVVTKRGDYVRKLARQLERLCGSQYVCCYEAGPCGYILQRELKKKGGDCRVVAPSRIPVQSGDRVKTDRRDAVKLAALLRAGLLTEVHPPAEREEPVRDLCRLRQAAVKDRHRSRQRLLKLLLRHGRIYLEGSHWTQKHRAWLSRVEWEDVSSRYVFDECRRAVDEQEERIQRLDALLLGLAGQPVYRERAGWLGCFAGIGPLTALSILAEAGDFTRFATARHFMAFLGLTPTERSSAETVRRGGITKTGNTHLRRLFIEAAWHCRHPVRVPAALAERRNGQPAWAVAIARQAHTRLSRRYYRLCEGRGKEKNKAVTAIARELAGFVWAMMRHPEAVRQTGCPAA